MTIVSRNRRFFWRMIPVLFLTALIGTPVGLAASTLAYGDSISLSLSTISVTASAAFAIAAALLIPAMLLWIVVFNWIIPNMFSPNLQPSVSHSPPPAIWRRAVGATMITSGIGAIALFILIDAFTRGEGSIFLALLPWAIVPVMLGCTLTWLAFRNLRTEDIGRRE
jgi:hypothetical protein